MLLPHVFPNDFNSTVFHCCFGMSVLDPSVVRGRVSTFVVHEEVSAIVAVLFPWIAKALRNKMVISPECRNAVIDAAVLIAPLDDDPTMRRGFFR